MTTKTKSRAVAPSAAAAPIDDLWSTVPLTTEDRLLRIQALGQRIDGYIRFMCAIGHLNGSSTEAKDKAVAVFYERLITMEQELGRIQEDLQLG